jgi:hypothetical protein
VADLRTKGRADSHANRPECPPYRHVYGAEAGRGAARKDARGRRRAPPGARSARAGGLAISSSFTMAVGFRGKRQRTCWGLPVMPVGGGVVIGDESRGDYEGRARLIPVPVGRQRAAGCSMHSRLGPKTALDV